MTKLLTKEAILGAKDTKEEDVVVPEWGGSVRMRTMLGEDRDAWETAMQAQKTDDKVDIRGMKALLISMCARNEEGALLFSAQDVSLLNKKNAKAIDRLWDVAARMNGIGDEQLEAARKNS